jgi:hypothetical protein
MPELPAEYSGVEVAPDNFWRDQGRMIANLRRQGRGPSVRTGSVGGRASSRAARQAKRKAAKRARY